MFKYNAYRVLNEYITFYSFRQITIYLIIISFD